MFVHVASETDVFLGKEEEMYSCHCTQDADEAAEAAAGKASVGLLQGIQAAPTFSFSS